MTSIPLGPFSVMPGPSVMDLPAMGTIAAMTPFVVPATDGLASVTAAAPDLPNLLPLAADGTLIAATADPGGEPPVSLPTPASSTPEPRAVTQSPPAAIGIAPQALPTSMASSSVAEPADRPPSVQIAPAEPAIPASPAPVAGPVADRQDAEVPSDTGEKDIELDRAAADILGLVVPEPAPAPTEPKLAPGLVTVTPPVEQHAASPTPTDVEPAKGHGKSARAAPAPAQPHASATIDPLPGLADPAPLQRTAEAVSGPSHAVFQTSANLSSDAVTSAPVPGTPVQATPAVPAMLQPVAPHQAPAKPFAVSAAAEPVVRTAAGSFGHELGVHIARRVVAGKDELTVRLDPVELGRIEVRMSFDEQGSLRAVVAAESPAALDLLRRESGDLGRALADAGVRADAQSFRFDSRGSGGSADAGMGGNRQQQPGQGFARQGYADQPSEDSPVHYRPLRSSGSIDLLA